MTQGRRRVYGARVKMTGEGAAISGGALIGCATAQDPSVLAYAYIFQGASYLVTGTPDADWSVTVDNVDYAFPASERGQSWTADEMDVAVVPITISGVEAGESPGSLIYWPVAADSNGYVDPPTSGSTGVYFDVNQHFHQVEFRTTWTVPDFKTVFIWNSTNPFGGPYLAPTPRNSPLGDGDVWVGAEPPPPGNPGGGGTQ